MGRTAKIGLFLLMGLVVALARLVEVEVGKVKAPTEPLPLLVKAEPAKGAHRGGGSGHHHGKHPIAPAPAPAHAPPTSPAPPSSAAPPAPEPSEAEWPKGSVYTVKKGETLGEISLKVLGSSHLWEKLLAANHDKLEKPEAVKVGMKLVVPPRAAPAAPKKD